MIAPVLPGISDDPDQIEAVVRAAVEAGATSITPIMLHLRPGVREHYLAWLRATRPELAEAHGPPLRGRLRPRRRAPRPGGMVRRMVAAPRRPAPDRAGALRARDRRRRRAARRPNPQQLSLL